MRLQVIARLLPATLLFLTASLAVLRAPTHLLWMLAIGATELGHFLALVCLGTAIPLWNNTWYGRTAAGLCIAAAIFATTPLLRATWIVGDIQQGIHRTFGNANVHRRPHPLVIDTRAKLTDYLGGSPSAFAANYEDASPIRHGTAGSPPVLFLHGGREEIVAAEHSNNLSRRLTELGVRNLCVSLPWATHGFDYLPGGPGGQSSVYAIESFLGSVLDQHG